MTRVCAVVVIGEGWEDIAFLAGFLDECGISDRKLEPKQNPKGKGSGFDFVRSTLAEEIAALQRYREGRGVVAVMDEDGQTIETRSAWVAGLLSTRRLPSLACAEGRCLVIPKRNIETWAYWLTGSRQAEVWAVDETTNYKSQPPPGASRRLQSVDWREAGKHLHTINHTAPPNGMPPQLLRSLTALREFVHAVRR